MHPRTALATLLLVSALDGHAQLLGSIQGAVIIGRPLDIVVQSRTVPGSDAQALCVQAQVHYGETVLAPSDVQVSVEGSGETGRLRVRAGKPVDEPFVTVQLRVGCPARFARSYTLLADVEPAAPTPPPTAAPARVEAAVAPMAEPLAPVVPRVSAPSVSPAPETPIRSLVTAPRPPGVARLASKVPVVRTRPVAGQQDAGTAVAPRVAEAPAPTGPRLKLEPVDLGQGGPMADGAGSQVSAGAVTGDAAAAGGTASAAGADPAALQQEVAALRAEQQRLLLAVESLNRELTAARESQNGTAWTVALGGVAVLLLAALAWMWRRQSQQSSHLAANRWWAATVRPAQPESVGVPPPPVPGEAPASAGVPRPTATAETAAPAPARAEVRAEGSAAAMAGLEVSEAGASVFQEVPVAPLDPAALHDLWSRVDFFESLGQIGDAVAALRTFVQAYPRACEAPYLRWWALAQQHNRDPRSAQAMYEQHYQRLMPMAIDDPAGLEADTALITALQHDWPTEAARARIEAALVSQPGEPLAPLQVRTLAAFDDLITLHGLLDLLPLMESAAAPAAAAASQGVPSMLDFELPDVADMSPRPKAEPAAPAARRSDDALDFHLDDWLSPAPPAPPERG